jgi:hypothetical protein
MTELPNGRERKVLSALSSGDPVALSDSVFYRIGEGTFGGMVEKGWITKEKHELVDRILYRITKLGKEVGAIPVPKTGRKSNPLPHAPARLPSAPDRFGRR